MQQQSPGVGALRGGRRHLARTCSCCGTYSSCKVRQLWILFFVPLSVRFLLTTGCATAIPPQQQQPRCEPPSRQTFANIAVRLRGTGCTQRRMRRRTAFHPSSTRRIFGGCLTSFPCRLAQNFTFSYCTSAWQISLSLSPSISAQHRQVNTAAAAKAANVFQDVLSSRRW